MNPVALVVFALTLAVHAVLAGAETALLCVNRLRVRHVARRDARVAALEALLARSGELRAAVRLALVSCRVPCLVAGLAWSSGVTGPGLWGRYVAVAVLLVVLGDALPRAWCRMRPMDRLVSAMGLLRRIRSGFGPLAGRLRGGGMAEEADEDVLRVTHESLVRMLRDAAATGVVSSAEHRMVARVLALRRQPVREVMAPVARIVSVEASTPLSGFYEACRRTGMVRMPVRGPGGALDFVGVINVFYVVGSGVDASRPVAEHMRPPLFVPVDMPVSEVLPRLRLNRQPMALVRSADGVVVGLVTLEDVLDAIVRDVA